MSKRHYTEVAEILRNAEDHSSKGLPSVPRRYGPIEYVALELALMFKRDNPRFDAGKFFDAAGFPELTGTRMGLN